jgi:hypothetical protein
MNCYRYQGEINDFSGILLGLIFAVGFYLSWVVIFNLYNKLFVKTDGQMVDSVLAHGVLTITWLLIYSFLFLTICGQIGI